MTSLADVYEGKVGETADLRRLYLGVGMFLAGSLSVVVAIAAATTQTGSIETIRRARWLAGVLAGVGVPAVFLGVFAVLPAGRVTRAAAVVGAGVSLLGVSLFAHAYPCRWAGANCAPGDLTLQTIAVYFLGVITAFWCLFVGVANFTSRNDPGGTVELEVNRGGETKTIEVSKSKLENEESATTGGVGFFGDTPDGEVETQTNRADAHVADDGGVGAGASDGGATPAGITGLRERDDDTTDTGVDRVGGASSPGGPRGPSGPSGSTDTGGTGGSGGPGAPSGPTNRGGPSGEPDATGSPADTYCGSCAHFQYVRTEDGMQPYCGYHDEVMEDMDACEEWTPR
ncbi:ribonuclease BN [Halobaculum sp. MBLA0143]|uniref:DUF7139 domain-containing protein n=1 Tax=Halobaculum sp. MBLA0143 TaxID=3079933 RepID=UPI003526628F